MTDKGKRLSGDGRVFEATVKRKHPFGRDDKADREAQRRATSYGRAKGKA